MVASVTAVSAGSAGVGYLTGGGACEADHEWFLGSDGEDAEARENASIEYYANGAAAGIWLGSGAADLGGEVGKPASLADVYAIYGDLADPRTGEAIGRAPRNFKSPTERLQAALEREPDASPERVAELTWQIRSSQRQAVGYYDVTFSAQKSVSVLHSALIAVGRTDEAAIVANAHKAAVAKATDYLEREAGYSRTGYHGRTKDGRSVGEYVAARRFVAVRFDHSTNRNQDPQLHSHVAVLNRLRCETDGEWRALDGRGLYAERRAAGAIYEEEMERLISEQLPVAFATRPDGKAREILGMPDELLAATSTRRKEILEATAVAEAEYLAAHGREPESYVKTVLAQKAALSTRQPKRADERSPEEVAAHLRQTAEDLGTPLPRVLQAVEDRRRDLDQGMTLEDVNRRELVSGAIAKVQEARSTWTRSDLIGALHLGLPPALRMGGAQVDEYLAELADEALTGPGADGVIQLTAPDMVPVPGVYRRESDDRSRWRPHRDERYATEGQLAAEDRLVAAAGRSGAPFLTAEQLVSVEADLVARGLGDDQRAAALGVLGSGRRGDVVIGPAGAGKSFMMAALQDHWEGAFNAPVLGMASSQLAAQRLAEEGLPSINVARFLVMHEDDPSREGDRLVPGTMLVIDESGMSSTTQLDRVRRVAERDGAKMLWTGDPEQTDSPGAGGSLRLLAERNGSYQLGQDADAVRRFNAPWEREASLGLREGSTTALRAYDEHGRITEGTREEVADQARRGWLADHLGGKRTLLMVGTNNEATTQSAALRQQLVALGRVEAEGVQLVDGNVAGVGDIIQSRQNARHLQDPSTGRWVVNRDMWRVDGRDAEGNLTARLLNDDRIQVTLPRDYVSQLVSLGYATTVHGAQGQSVDTGHALIDPNSWRELLYVMMTRGAERNMAYVVTQEPRNDDNVQGLDSDRIAVLNGVLDRSGAQRAAQQVMRDELEASESLATLGTVWGAVTSEQGRDRALEQLGGVLSPDMVDELRDSVGADRLWRRVREAELAGYDGASLVARAAADRELITARDTADVLRWRVHNLTGDAPRSAGTITSWVDRTVPQDGAAGQFAMDLALAMDGRQRVLGELAAANPPAWAADLGPGPEEPLAAEEWVSGAGAVAAYRELAGIPDAQTALGAAPSREMPVHRAAWEAAFDAYGRPDAAYDVAGASDDQLGVWITNWHRAQEWAPEYAADLLRQAELRWHKWNAEAEIASAALQSTRNPDDAQATERRLSQAERIRDQLAEQVRALEVIHEGRMAWWEHTSGEREQAHRAEDEYRQRHGHVYGWKPDQEAAEADEVDEPAAEVDAAEVDAAEVDAAEVDAAEVDAAEVDAAEVGELDEPAAAEVDDAEVDAAEVDEPAAEVVDEPAAEVDAAEVGELDEPAAAEVDDAEVDAAEVDEPAAAEVDEPAAAEVDEPAADAAEVDAAEVDAAEVDAAEVGEVDEPAAAEVDEPAADAAEVDAAEVDAAEVDAAEVGELDEPAAAEVDDAEVDDAEVDAAEVDAAEVDAAEVDAAEVGELDEPAAAEVDTVGVGAAEVDAAKVDAAEVDSERSQSELDLGLAPRPDRDQGRRDGAGRQDRAENQGETRSHGLPEEGAELTQRFQTRDDLNQAVADARAALARIKAENEEQAERSAQDEAARIQRDRERGADDRGAGRVTDQMEIGPRMADPSRGVGPRDEPPPAQGPAGGQHL